MSQRAAVEYSARIPPKVPGYPVVGALPGLLRGQLDFLESARRRYGDVYELDLGFIQATVLCHPRHAQHILLDNARNYTKGGPLWDSIRTFIGNGLPVSEGEFWKRQRRMIQPAFHHQRLVALTGRMVEAIDECLEDWEPAARSGQPFDVAQAFTRMTMHVLVRTVFGGSVEPAEALQVGRSLAYIIDYMLQASLTNALPGWVPVPGRERYREELRRMDEIVARVIARGRQGGQSQDTLISLLLDMVDSESGERMTDAQLRDEAVSLFAAGYETTSVAMSWAYHFLTREPHIAGRLQAGVDRVLGGRSPRFEDLSALGYTRGVLQEALRLYSPTYWLPRTAVEDDMVDGYRIPAGRMVGVFSHLLHRHPEVWSEPLKFDPERYTPERSEGRHKLAWIPFGAGQRQCIGKEFALMEGQLILARIAQRYEVSAVPGREARLHLGTTLRAKDGVWVHLAARAGGPSVAA